MRKFWIVCTVAMATSLSSCIDNDKDLRIDDSTPEINNSDFSTEQTVKIEINYATANTKVPFFIYDQNPLIIGENTVSLREDIDPLDGGWTDDQGKYTGEMKLPAYASDIYIVSRAFYAQTLMQGKIVNGTLTVSDTDEDQPSARASYNDSDSKRFQNLGWNTNLGSFNASSGKINYAFTGNDPKLTLSSSEMTALENTVYKVLDKMGTCPADYRTSADLYVEKENTAVVLTAIGGNTCWNSSLGYYYYRADASPKTLKDVKVYAVFPNTQTGTWRSGSMKGAPVGVTKGTAVQLKFFGDNGEASEGKNFPAGYRIGFVLACNGWNTYFTGFGSYPDTWKYYSSSTKGFSSKGVNGMDVHTAMFKERKSGNIAIAFEDFRDDENFTDLVFALKANPEITNVPDVDPDYNTTIEKTGVYAFEDQWPAAEDYDMNDVIVQHTYQKTYNIYNEILEESFKFKTFANGAAFLNGLAFSLKDAGTVTTEDYIRYNDSDEFVATTYDHEPDNVIKLTDNVKFNMNGEYKVTIKYDKSVKKTKETSIDAFIYRPSANNLRLEVHCPMQKPTVKADFSFFGTFDDHSDPNAGRFYVSAKENLYPFAFYLSNANIKDIAPLLDPNNESIAISELYPTFIDWSKDNSQSTDWYKKK